MNKSHDLLRNVRVAAPCHASWNEMDGDERARFCGQCKRQVFNLSGMSADEAETLLRERTGRLCVRYYQRADGTILTRNCPVGLAAVRHRLVLVAAASLAIVTTAVAVVRRPDEPAKPFKVAKEKYGEAKEKFRVLLGGEPIAAPLPHPSSMIMGEMICPPTPPSKSVSPAAGP